MQESTKLRIKLHRKLPLLLQSQPPSRSEIQDPKVPGVSVGYFFHLTAELETKTQRAQNKDVQALQLKLDELLKHENGADEKLIRVDEDATQAELKQMPEKYKKA